jgi:DNA-binding transcriptional LysR family regulator
VTYETVETQDLLVFLAVARTGSLGAAAAELRLATPSVSARMSALEQKLTTELFVRTTRGSSLTPAGERLVPYARRCLAILQEAHQAVRTEPHQRVIVAAPASLGAVVFPAVLKILGDAALSAHCRVAHSEEVIAYLLDGTADIGLVLNRMVPGSIVVHRLCRSKLLTVCHPDHPLVARPTVSVDDLVTTRIAAYRWSPEAEGLAEIFEHPRRPRDRPIQLLGLPAAVIELVTDRDYIAIIPEFAAAAPLRAGAIVELPLALPGWSLDVQLAYRRDVETSAGVRSLLAAGDAIVSVMTRDGTTRSTSERPIPSMSRRSPSR